MRSPSTEATAWFPALRAEEAWDRLPPRSAGTAAGLPLWGRVLARSLPHTTAAMLELDRVARQETSLAPQLRAKLRWILAAVHHCPAAQAEAQGDFTAGGGQGQLSELLADRDALPEAERRTFRFAEQLSTEAWRITDAEVEYLLGQHGPADLVAIVLLTAYANFQDRLLHALGAARDAGEGAPPAAVRFDWERAGREFPPASRGEHPVIRDDDSVPRRLQDAQWTAISWDELRQRLAEQQKRSARIPFPPDEVVERHMPPGLYAPGQSTAIRWNAATFGYQPALAAAWIFTLRRFMEESGFVSDFRQTIFWVITRSLQCFY